MLDLEAATTVLTRVIERVSNDQLTEPTPCSESRIGDLLDHVDGLSVAFTAAATKSAVPGEQTPRADGNRLGQDWRTRIPQRLAGLAAAWRDEAAWTGMTQVGGQDLPGEVAGVIALDEVVVHGWDIAVASGQPFGCEQALLEAAYGFVQPTAEQNPTGVPGLFGPAVPVPPDAELLDRLIGMTGRDPAWRPGERST